MTPDSVTNYEVLENLDQVRAISHQWDSLLEQSDCNHAFSSATWFLNCCQLKSTLRLCVVVARQHDRPVGILPLAVVDDDREATFPTFLCDYNDAIVAEGDLDVAVGLLKHALRPSAGYDRLYLYGLRDDSNCVQAMLQLDSSCRVVRTTPEQCACPYIHLPQRYEDYVASRSKRLRATMRRSLRRAKDGCITTRLLGSECFSTARIASSFLSLVQQRLGARSCFFMEENQEFVMGAVPELLDQCKMIALGSFDRDDLIAIRLFAVSSRSLCSWNGGFRPEANRWAPGTLLTDAGIREAFSREMLEYDCLRGAEAYKLRWTNRVRHLSDYVISQSGSQPRVR